MQTCCYVEYEFIYQDTILMKRITLCPKSLSVRGFVASLAVRLLFKADLSSYKPPPNLF